MKSIRVDEEVYTRLTQYQVTPNQAIRKILGLPETKHNKPRRKSNRLIRILRILFQRR